VKLSDALKFSWDRLAEHPSPKGFPLQASDFGITIMTPTKGFFQFEPITKSWADLNLDLRRELLQSTRWEPVDPKPAMLVLAEAYALDWSDDSEQPSDDSARSEKR
jgi:hypothetical protein